MGLFEDTVAKAKDAFDVAAKKTEEVWSVQKLKFSIASLNSQISKEYETLGRIYYDSIKNETDITESVKLSVDEIDDKTKQVKIYEDEIADQKNMIICDNCKARNPSDAMYCAKCGTKFN